MQLAELDKKYIFYRQIPRSDDPGDYVLRCRRGFLYQDGDKIGYYAQFATTRKKNYHRNRILEYVSGSRIHQEGDREVIVLFPKDGLEEALGLVWPRKRKRTFGVSKPFGTMQ